MDGAGERLGNGHNAPLFGDLYLGLDGVAFLLPGIELPLSPDRAFDALFGGVDKQDFKIVLLERAVLLDPGDPRDKRFENGEAAATTVAPPRLQAMREKDNHQTPTWLLN